eukprot:4651927-Prymnesium_polylepis.1
MQETALQTRALQSKSCPGRAGIGVTTSDYPPFLPGSHSGVNGTRWLHNGALKLGAQHSQDT